jgi:hypothetical protein
MTGRSWIAALAAAVLLAAGAWGLWWPGRADPAAPATGPSSAPSAASSPVEEYREFAMALDPATATSAQLVDGLRALAGAVGVATGGEASAVIDLRIAAEHIELNPEDVGTTVSVRGSLVSAAEALDDPAFQSAAASIEPQGTVEAQRTAIATALVRAAAALPR